jgi:amino acid adenylation domain-containing protein
LSDLPLLSADERQQLLVEWNDTEADYPVDACIHQLFEAQVERTPDAIAVVFEDEQITYQELNSRSNKIARYLQKLGVGSEVLVGICLERSVDLIVGLLGILKAGGAYVPLDPSYPQERLLFMLEDAQLSLVISQLSLVSSFGQMANDKEQRAVICLDRDWEIIAQQSDENLSNDLTSDNLAYVMYTSGSTGKPKGVAIPHKAVSRLVFNTNYVKLDSSDKIAQVSNTSFDAATFEIWGTLLHGAQLVGISKDIALSPHDFASQLRQKGISVLFLTTALFQQVARVVPQAFSSLRYLLFGGEVVEPRWVQEVLKNGSPKQLLHVYGPTESTTFSSYYWVQDVAEEATSIPIGRAIANTQIYLLDEQLQPVPIGVPGELYIGGDGLARGYLNRPELTAERFILNPFSKAEGRRQKAEGRRQKAEECDRLYKTGDLARYLPDGNIEYLGRIDNQVKIRGFRIELGEIEVALSQHPDVLQSIVTVREDVPGDKRLVAYIVPDEQQSKGAIQNPKSKIQNPKSNDLRRFLKQKLPDYMMPYAFVMLDTLPLTTNGKVDRRALPAPEMARPELSQTFVAPKSPIEEMLALMWADVLGVEQVGIHDNFFELGGHSLLATQLIGRVREAFSIELPLRDLFESPTVAGLSEVIETVRQAGEGLQAPAIEPLPRDGNIPLSFAQARLWFLNQLEGGSATYNIPVALRLTGFIDVAALEQAIGKIVQRHEVLRTTFHMVDGVPVQVITPTSSVPLSVVDLQALPEEEQSTEVQRLVTEEARAIFELTNSPLLRVTLLRLGEKSHVLLLVMHHIISDGWSLGIFVQELSALYEAFSKGTPSVCFQPSPSDSDPPQPPLKRGENSVKVPLFKGDLGGSPGLTTDPSPLPALPVQYADFTRWQQQWLSGAVLETQLNYWQQQLAGAPPLLELPTDRSRPPVQTFQGSIHPVKLNRDLTQKLKNLSQQSGATLFMTLLAAFVTLLSRYSGQQDIVVGSPIANRNRAEVEGLIGFFANTLALRTDLSGDPTFTELLSRVREVTMGAYAHQDLPFEKLVEAVQPERALSRNPLVQVVFALQNAPIPSLELPGLKLDLWEFDFGTVRFDLEVLLREVPEGLSGHFVYSTDLFDSSTIARMAGHFQTLLEGIAANSEQRLSELPLLTEAERQQLLVSSNGVETDSDPGNEEQMLAQLDGLSDEEVNALLNQMLGD